MQSSENMGRHRKCESKTNSKNKSFMWFLKTKIALKIKLILMLKKETASFTTKNHNAQRDVLKATAFLNLVEVIINNPF